MLILASVLTLCFGWGSLLASPLHPYTDQILEKSGAPQLRIARYAGRSDFKSETTIEWSKHPDGLFYSGNKMYTRILEGLCETLLEDYQKFPLQKMVRTQYLKANEIQDYLRMSLEFKQGQVTFSQITREMGRNDAQAIFGRSAYDHIAERYHQDVQRVAVITATLWSVAGQVLDTETGQLDLAPLPWQKDAARKELAANFDRKKYPYVWEWGRAGQDVVNEVKPLYAVNAATNYQELVTHGGRLEDAFIMFHSFSETNTAYYLKLFPNSIYPEGWADRSDALFLVPLREALKRFPPSEFSAKLHRLRALTDGVLSETAAIEFLQKFDSLQFTAYDSQMHSSQPIAVRDMSTISQQRRSNLATASGVLKSTRTDDLVQFLMNLQPVLPTWNSGQYKDLADMQLTGFYVLDANALEISNLDGLRSRFDPDYIPKILLAALLAKVEVLQAESAHAMGRTPTVREVLQWLMDHQVNFAISTFDPKTIEALRRCSPASEHKHSYVKYADGAVPEFPGQEWNSMGHKQDALTFLFPAAQLAQWIGDFPWIYHKALRELKEGRWQKQLLLTHPEVF